MTDSKKQLDYVIKLSDIMTQIKDIDVLMETILTEARKITFADAGSIYLCKNDELSFDYAQNETLSSRLGTGKKLIYKTFRLPKNTESIAGYVAITGKILNLRDVYQLDPKLPFGFNKEFDRVSNYETTSMLTIPLKRVSNNKIIGVLQLINAKDETGNSVPFSEDNTPLVKLFANSAAMALERAEMTRAIILRMIKLAELRDPKETGAHVNRVGAYSAEIYEAWAEKHSINKEEIKRCKDTIRIAAMLHDVGKVAIPDTILKKSGKLTDEEFEIMKTHTYEGAKLFGEKQSELDIMSQEIALNHHEHWDGRGYPGHIDMKSFQPLAKHILPNGRAMGKKRDEIPLAARIVSISDVYDALSSRRVYKEAWSQDDVIREIEEQAGKQFDPQLVEIFSDLIDVFQAIQSKYSD